MERADQRRRALLAVAMLAVAPWSMAQERALTRPRRVAACLDHAETPPVPERSRRYLAKLFAQHGVVQGRDIEILIRRAKGYSPEDMAAEIRQAAESGADVILAHMHGPDAKRFVLPLKPDVPLVLWGVDAGGEDSIEELNRRGENVTGSMYSYVQLVIKRFELLKELRPAARRAALVIPADAVAPSAFAEGELRRGLQLYKAGAGTLGLEFELIRLPRGVSGAGMAQALRKAAIDIAEINPVWLDSDRWEALAANGVAASGIQAQSARRGALLGGWTVGYVETAIRIAAKVVRGERAASIPVERPTHYGLAINLRTARVLGIKVPASMIVRADQVFDE